MGKANRPPCQIHSDITAKKKAGYLIIHTASVVDVALDKDI